MLPFSISITIICTPCALSLIRDKYSLYTRCTTFSVAHLQLLATHLIEQLDEHLHHLSEQVRNERKTIDENDPATTARLQTLEQERVEMEVLKVKVEHLDLRNDEHKTSLHLAAMSGNME